MGSRCPDRVERAVFDGEGDRPFDLAVVGAGSAGFAAAITAAERGARVLLVGHGAIGGTCVNIGCVPSKFLIRAAEAVHAGRHARRFPGITGETRLVDWRALQRARAELVARLRHEKYEALLPHYPTIRYLEGRARLVADGVEVDGTRHRARAVVLTTGARPAIPPIPGIDGVGPLTSTEALELDELPSSLLVIGAGDIGCELAQAFARFGSAVTLLCRRRPLPEQDPEVSEALARFLEADGIRLVTGVRYRRIWREEDEVVLEVERAGTVERHRGRHVLVATGRVPNTEDLGLDGLGIATDERGFVRVDRHLRTSRPGVYAAGDVTGRHMFVYTAARQARIAALNALEGDRHVYEPRAVPQVVFTDPQVATVGLGAEAARRQGFEVEVRTLPLDQLPRALAALDTRGLVRLVAERKSRRLLGAQVVAPEGADSIQTATVAIEAGWTVERLIDVLSPYLTTVEGLRLAAQTFEKDVSRLSCCAA